jgi:hypothetical protein
MRNHPIIVQKYGGVCLETPAKIRGCAQSPSCMAVVIVWRNPRLPDERCGTISLTHTQKRQLSPSWESY